MAFSDNPLILRLHPLGPTNVRAKCPELFSCGLVKKPTLIEETEDISLLNFTAIAKGWSQKQEQNQSIAESPDKTVVLCGSGPPIYKNSSICLVQAASTVLQEADRLPSSGGIYTPLSAFSKTSLPSRLQKNGIVYKEIERKNTKCTVI